jgi:ubiquinone/menaquinone biosynthesis C-methylase UbiE
MNDSTNKSPRAKRQFYAQPEIAKEYDELRFGGASGAWVNEREIEIALRFATPFRCALDVGCGTGRLMRAFAKHGKAVGVDTSLAMLEQSRRQDPASDSADLVRADAFSLPFANASFDTVLALRFIFHFEDIETLFREVARILTLRGSFVFDAYIWSPRMQIAMNSARWGGKIYNHPSRKVEQIARALGFQIQIRETAFLFSPFIYRLLPLPMVRALDQMERHMPARFRSRVFWKLVRGD